MQVSEPGAVHPVPGAVLQKLAGTGFVAGRAFCPVAAQQKFKDHFPVLLHLRGVRV